MRDMSALSTSFKSLIAVLALATLAACGDKEPAKTASTPSASSAPVGNVYEAVAARATGFTVGNMMAARTVYVFFDSQCPHCATLWRDVKPLLGQLRMVWIPVRLLAEISAQQGAMILSASDPSAEMDRHEKMRDTGGKGLEPRPDIPKEQIDKVRANTELMTSIGGGAVPYLVFKNPTSGAPSAYEGGADTEGLKKLFGL